MQSPLKLQSLERLIETENISLDWDLDVVLSSSRGLPGIEESLGKISLTIFKLHIQCSLFVPLNNLGLKTFHVAKDSTNETQMMVN